MKFRYKNQRVVQLKDCKPGYKYKLEPTHISDRLEALWIIDQRIYWDSTKYYKDSGLYMKPKHCGTALSPEQRLIAESLHFIVTNIYRRKLHAN